MAKFQEDGVFSSRSRLSLLSGLPRNLRDFTLCARISLNYLRGSHNYWLNVGNDTHEELLTGGDIYFGTIENTKE